MDKILKIILTPQTLILLGALFTAILGLWEALKEKKRVIGFGLFILAIISAVGGFWASNNAKTFEKQLFKKNDFIINNLTEKDSYCFIALLQPSGHIRLIHSGKYPLFDVTLCINDLDSNIGDFIKFKNSEISAYDFGDKMFSKLLKKNIVKIGTVTAVPDFGLIGDLQPIDLKQRNKLNLVITINTRCHKILQNLLMIRVDPNKWVSATKVIDFLKNNKILYQQIDPEYPRNEKGEIDWTLKF